MSASTTNSQIEGSATRQVLWSRLPDAYAIPDHAPSLADAQRYCRQLARSHYENFSVATWFLPRKLRQDFFNVYAYCRWADDLGDEISDRAESLRLLGWWRTELAAMYQGAASAGAMAMPAKGSLRERQSPVTSR